jgi:hypothetical protein
MTTESAKLNRVELMRKIREIIDAASNDPVEEMRTTGEALCKVAEALKGHTPSEARAIIAAVMALEGK